MIDGIEIIDGHCHIASSRFIPDEFFRGIASNMVVKMQADGQKVSVDGLTTLLKKGHQDHQGDHLIAEMDSANISQSVVLLPDFTYCMESELSIEAMYEEHWEIQQRYPGRFIFFAGIDPRHKNALAIFKKAVECYGSRGLKLYPPCGYSPSDDVLTPIYRYCQDNHLPVLLHTGATSPRLSFEPSRCFHIDEAARRFSGVNFILAHAGVNDIQNAEQLCRFRPNVYMDISAFSTLRTPGGWQAHLKKLFALELNHKIIFGTDWPISGIRQSAADLMKQFLSADGPLQGLSLNDINQLMSGNVKRLLPG